MTFYPKSSILNSVLLKTLRYDQNSTINLDRDEQYKFENLFRDPIFKSIELAVMEDFFLTIIFS